MNYSCLARGHQSSSKGNKSTDSLSFLVRVGSFSFLSQEMVVKIHLMMIFFPISSGIWLFDDVEEMMDFCEALFQYLMATKLMSQPSMGTREAHPLRAVIIRAHLLCRYNL